MDKDTFIPEKSPIDYLSNRNGVFFTDAPEPPIKHRCKVQTIVRLTSCTIYRCACGGMRVGVLGFWNHKNSRIPKEKS